MASPAQPVMFGIENVYSTCIIIFDEELIILFYIPQPHKEDMYIQLQL